MATPITLIEKDAYYEVGVNPNRVTRCIVDNAFRVEVIAWEWILTVEFEGKFVYKRLMNPISLLSIS
jgi:hypothetical protein